MLDQYENGRRNVWLLGKASPSIHTHTRARARVYI